MMSRALRFFLLTTLALVLSSCEGDIYRSSIPDAPVHLELNLVSQYPNFANSVNQYILFTKPRYTTDRIGYGGVIVYSTYEGKYSAFDLACPVEAKRDVIVSPDGTGLAKCETCGEVYDMMYGFGNPTKGVSKEPLKMYKTFLHGNTLLISLK